MKITDSNNNYNRPDITNHDIISNDIELFKQKLEGFIQIHSENYEDIETGLWIKYVSNEGKYRSGGILKQNNAPDYFVLKSPYNNITWSVNLQKNSCFIKDVSCFREKMIQKNNLFKLYEAGLVKILDKPES